MGPTKIFNQLKEFTGAGDVPKFGTGSVVVVRKEQADCEEITVFMVCYGQATSEKRRVIVPKDTPLENMRELFGRSMAQEVMRDENDFTFNGSDLKRPVYMFSNKCNLNLAFCYDNHVEQLVKKISTLRRAHSDQISD